MNKKNVYFSNGIKCCIPDNEYDAAQAKDRCSFDGALFDFLTEIVNQWPYNELTVNQRDRLHMLLTHPIRTDSNPNNFRIFGMCDDRMKLLYNMYTSFLVGCGYKLEDLIFLPNDTYKCYCPKCIEKFADDISDNI